jgi:hypothetical protein
MNLLRARVKHKKDWFQVELLDLAIFADGPTEEAMLRDLEHSLRSEYELALQAEETPFVKLFRGCPKEVSDSWHDDGEKKLRHLDLPAEVRRAIAAVFHSPSHKAFQVVDANYASAA